MNGTTLVNEGEPELPHTAPRVLILDDEPDALQRRSRLLAEHYDLEVVAFQSADEAAVYLRLYRNVDLIVADVNLRGAGAVDFSGADFAASAYEMDPSVPIFLYSGVIGGQRQLSDRHRFAMRRFIKKATSANELERELLLAERQATEHRKSIQTRVEKIVGRLREGQQPNIQELTALKSYTPGSSTESDRETQLLREGYELDVLDTESGQAILYWWRRNEDMGGRVDVELFGHEYLQFVGDDRFDAIDVLTRVLTAFISENREGGRPSVGNSARLKEYTTALTRWYPASDSEDQPTSTGESSHGRA